MKNDEEEPVPYNPENKLISKTEVIALLGQFGIPNAEISPNHFNLYCQAFVHKSYCTRKNQNVVSGNQDCPSDCLPLQDISNERLEYLGDSVLNLSVASYLYERYPQQNEGFLSNLRSKLVNGIMLSNLASKLKLAKYLIVAKQIDRESPALLEDLLEAFLGATYLTFGFEKAKTFIIELIEHFVDFAELVKTVNYKDTFMKHYRHLYQTYPKFWEQNIEISKKTQKKIYTLCVKDLEGKVIAIGRGEKRKDAEQETSRKALEYYGIKH